MTQLEMFKNNWKPNYSDSSYECFCFRTDLNKLVEEIRTDEREKVLKEVEKKYERIILETRETARKDVVNEARKIIGCESKVDFSTCSYNCEFGFLQCGEDRCLLKDLGE